jgi:LAO/AO transport system kinase
MQALAAWRREHRHWAAARALQARRWFEAEVRHGLLAALMTGPASAEMARLGRMVEAGQMTPEVAADEMLAALRAR